MEFYRNNRIDQRFEATIPDLTDLFLASAYADREWPLDRSLRNFLTDPDGPISAVWTDELGYEELYQSVAAARRPSSKGSSS